MVGEELADRFVGKLDQLRRLERPGVGRAAFAFVEESHLTEQVTVFHQRHHRLAPIEGAVGDRDTAGHDNVERGRLVVLAEQDVAALECSATAGAGDRFEVFLGPVELANGYVELTDAAEQLRRIEADNESRRRRGRAVRPVDRHLIAALESGLPECAGVALGIERLQMLFHKTDDIGKVITFSFRETE